MVQVATQLRHPKDRRNPVVACSPPVPDGYPNGAWPTSDIRVRQRHLHHFERRAERVSATWRNSTTHCAELRVNGVCQGQIGAAAENQEGGLWSPLVR